jgi:ribosome-binding factor A
MYARNERLKELFKIEIIEALRGVKDPGVGGLLTITDLELAPDRKNCSVFYSILGSENERHSTQKALERASPYIRQVLRKRLTLKTIPNIHFVYDDTPKKASRIDKLLLDLEKDQ